MITRCDSFGNVGTCQRFYPIKDMRDLGVPSLTYKQDGRILLTIVDWGDAFMVFDYRKKAEDAEIWRIAKK